MKECFKDWNPHGATMERVVQCDAIIEEYASQGLKLTLRQLYYQFVARGIIPNTERSYKNLGSIVSNARMAGLLDWDAIEDRGRKPDEPNQFDSIKDLVEVALRAYRLDRWRDQSTYTELWVEKAALAGVLEPLAREFHVTLMVNKGYSSQSAMYESAQRIFSKCQVERHGIRPAIVLYLGDHDPSGQDMVRDIGDRLRLFTGNVLQIQIRTIALTTDQVEQYQPPPNPTKLTDSRAVDYIRRHGRECWEVDALDPATLQQLIRSAFEDIVDMRKMNAIKRQEERDRKGLRQAVELMR